MRRKLTPFFPAATTPLAALEIDVSPPFLRSDQRQAHRCTVPILFLLAGQRERTYKRKQRKKEKGREEGRERGEGDEMEKRQARREDETREKERENEGR